MKTLYLILFSLLFGSMSFAQVSPDKYWVKFTDKNDSPYSIENPEEFLSQKAIDRRDKQGINIKTNDLPVNPQYVEAVTGTGATILTLSKWFNSVTIYTTDQSALNTINSFAFVQSVVKCSNDDNINSEKPFFAHESFTSIPEANILKSGNGSKSYNYGQAYNQIDMLNGIALHDLGYDGAGMIIAVLDAGFLNADDMVAFDSLWNNNQILGYKDFVNPQNPNIFGSHYHGSMVLSTMGANWPGQIVGTAPKADYWLLRSEDGDSEYIIEELNWVSAAEFADSVGVDVINSSLGYTTFDDPSQSHTYTDMDGNTAPITIGADIAVSKGMIVVNSAGNSGGSSWQYIGAPADGDSVFSIGAVNGGGNYANFSSTGPTYDGRVKPNVVAQGQGSTIVEPWDGQVSSGNGTSFSSPITAGMVACLWQANPMKRNIEIMEAIETSSSQSNNPDDQLGYGIPDYALANSILTVIEHPTESDITFSAFPNPFTNEINIEFSEDGLFVSQIELLDVTGKVVLQQKVEQAKQYMSMDNVDDLSAGYYLIKVYTNESVLTEKVLKQ